MNYFAPLYYIFGKLFHCNYLFNITYYDVIETNSRDEVYQYKQNLVYFEYKFMCNSIDFHWWGKLFFKNL